ncbi:hypothetical protein VQ056_14065 [Paenibacillus sp. JTLBN-2024]
MFGSEESQVSYSRNVLKNFRNLSSATILFVLKEMKSELARQEIDRPMAFRLAFVRD